MLEKKLVFKITKTNMYHTIPNTIYNTNDSLHASVQIIKKYINQ